MRWELVQVSFARMSGEAKGLWEPQGACMKLHWKREDEWLEEAEPEWVGWTVLGSAGLGGTSQGYMTPHCQGLPLPSMVLLTWVWGKVT